jgi:hypothetical protein
VWVADSGVHGLTEIDPKTGAVRRRLGLDVAPAALAVDGDAIWVASYDAGVVEQLDRQSGTVIDTIPVGQRPGAIAVGRDAVWVANSLLVGSKRLGGRPRAVTAAGDRVWIASAASAESHRGGTLTLVWTGRFASTDPAFVLETDRQSTRPAYDTLVTYQASAGAAGLRLLPDLAVAVSRPANGGRSTGSGSIRTSDTRMAASCG